MRRMAGPVFGLAAVAPRHAARVRWRRLLESVAGPPATKPRPRPRRAVPAQPLMVGRLAMAATEVVAVVTLAAGAVGFVLAGPVAAGVLAAYAAVGSKLAMLTLRRRAAACSRSSAVQAVSVLAGDLRAGSSVEAATREAARFLVGPEVIGDEARAVAGRVASAVEVAEASGAPLADVLERLDAHLRAVDRARATASAQAAGARVSALMLAAMPVAGLGLGGLIGVDSTGMLLHTPLGSACLVAAVVLQLGGLAWSARLSRVEVSA